MYIHNMSLGITIKVCRRLSCNVVTTPTHNLCCLYNMYRFSNCFISYSLHLHSEANHRLWIIIGVFIINKLYHMFKTVQEQSSTFLLGCKDYCSDFALHSCNLDFFFLPSNCLKHCCPGSNTIICKIHNIWLFIVQDGIKSQLVSHCSWECKMLTHSD